MNQFVSSARVLFLGGVVCLFNFAARADLWSTGYYPGWEQGALPASNIDFTALTHIIHFSVIPNTDGTLNSSANGVSLANSTDIVARAHAAGKPVLICVGGAGSESDFQAATTNAILPVFISSLTNFMATRGYDGVDLDWEPLTAADAGQFTNLVNGLRSALECVSPAQVIDRCRRRVSALRRPADDGICHVRFAAKSVRSDQHHDL